MVQWSRHLPVTEKTRVQFPVMAPTLPIPHPLTPNFMLHHYRFSIEPPASLPASLQPYADALWIHYTVFPDGSIFADMPGGCLIIEGAAGYGADAGRSLAG